MMTNLTDSQGKRFLVMAGGTGGHVFPGLAVAKKLLEQGHTVTWLGTKTGIEADLVPEAGIEIDFIDIKGVRGKGIVGLLLAPVKIVFAIAQSLKKLLMKKPQCVLGLGGFVSGPGAVAAKLLGLPLVIHEQNAIPGTTNRISAKFANCVLEAFPKAFSPEVNAEFVGNPVRKDLIAKELSVSEQGSLRVLVLGGSLGAKAINEIMPQVIESLNFDIDLWHQAGKLHIDTVSHSYSELNKGIKVSAFIENMAEAYQWADLVICRSGAMTVSELAVMGLPAIFIPFPFAIDDHQTANAKWMVDAGAAILLQQDDMSVDVLVSYISELNEDKNKLADMSKNALEIGIQDAAEKVASCCVEWAQ